MKWLLLIAACQSPMPASQPVDLNAAAKSGTLAVRVGRGGITVEQLKAKLDALGAGKERYRDPKELRAFVDNQVRFELLAEEAMRRGLDKDPEVQDTARRTMVQKLMATTLEATDPTDSEVEKMYQNSIGDYRQPERVQLAIFAFPTRAEAESMAAKLKTSQETGTDQRFFSEQELISGYGPEVSVAAFGVKELGTVGPVVQSSDKRYVAFKVIGRRAAFNRPLSDAEGGIKQRLQRQKRNDAFEALITKLRKEVPVTIDEAKLQEVWAQPASLPR